MMGPEFRVYLLMGAALVAGAALGAALIHNRWLRVYGAFLAAHVFGALGLILAARQGQHMQGLGFAVILAVFVLPATLGMVLGGGLMWWRRR
ncbi:MAG: hypothetical protein LAT78_12620 [Roseinatronobacter sp.]|nr:hypothetical protein [Roseinatronobacter sp.]